ncbi:MAG: hypothetical protein ABI067_05675 [Leifsonia sp.]
MTSEQAMTDPINDPNFNEYTYRAPNEATITELKRIADDFHAAKDIARDLRRELDNKLREAKASGHSYTQLRDACGFSIATIQLIIEKGQR